MNTSDRAKRIVLISVLCLWTLAGVMYGLLDESSSAYGVLVLAHGLLTSLLALLWVHYDSETRDYKPSKALRLMICLLAIVALPYYLLRSRGLNGIVTILKAVGFLILISIVNAITQAITEVALMGSPE